MTMENVQFKVTSTETVKPSSPTPPHLRTFRLSLYDQLAPNSYVPIVLFYPNNSNTNNNNNNDDNDLNDASHISFSLKKSLSETLSKYYPVAGRFTAGVPSSVDCNDEGVTFLVTQFECSLPEILNQPELTANMNLFFPPDTPWRESDTDALLVLQLSFFRCGGFAVGACMSHKIADASTVCNFINDWSLVSRRSPSDPPQTVNPELFAGASVFPPRELPIMRKTTQPGPTPEKFVTRRLTFDSSNIANLKSKIPAEQNPTRVQAVTALIYTAASKSNSTTDAISRPSVVSQTVNMRSRMVPPLPRNSVGNVICPSLVFVDQDHHDLSGIVGLLNRGVREAVDKYARYMKADELWGVISEYFEELEGMLGSKNARLYRFSSWCRYPLYEVDFGWGNPVWAGIAGCPFVNTIMMDGRGGEGIEAWVTLEESDMKVFERNPELLAFGSLDSKCF